MPSSEVAATQDPSGLPPERIDVSWLILQWLEDIRRDQHRLRAEQNRLYTEFDGLRRHMQQEMSTLRQDVGQEIGRLRQEVGGLRQEMGQLRQEVRQEVNGLRREFAQQFSRLTGWFIAGLVAVLGTVIGLRFLP